MDKLFNDDLLAQPKKNYGKNKDTKAKNTAGEIYNACLCGAFYIMYNDHNGKCRKCQEKS